jgi:hypothetical protein
MSKKNELSKDEAKLIFGGAQTGANSSGNNVNDTIHPISKKFSRY